MLMPAKAYYVKPLIVETASFQFLVHINESHTKPLLLAVGEDAILAFTSTVYIVA